MTKDRIQKRLRQLAYKMGDRSFTIPTDLPVSRNWQENWTSWMVDNMAKDKVFDAYQEVGLLHDMLVIANDLWEQLND